ncbi:MAG: malonyl-ACP O-methyltransferase BioC [Gammaproteobacteria bacterium]|nr:malonyl-ACP O-methyltransferase BioC [Gammaproteobacteria bacterium]
MLDSEKKRIQKHFNLKAKSYEASAVLQQEVCNRLLEKLSWVKHAPEYILDAGSGTGWGTKGLMSTYSSARVIAMDLSVSMLKQTRGKGGLFRKPSLLCADAESIPLADDSVDLIFSSLMLQWCDPEKVFKEFLRVLKPGGLLMFASFGPDTLKELRTSWSKVDQAVHVNDFIDMHDLGDSLLATGFAEPVMDMDMMTLIYDDAITVMKDLQLIGANTPLKNNAKGLLTPGKLQRVINEYEAFRENESLPATYEIIYGHAWKIEKKNNGHGDREIHLPVDSIKLMTR